MGYNLILLDIETQRDLFLPGGSCYSRKAGRAAKNVYALFAWVRKHRIPVVSTVLRVRRGLRGPLADVPHCVDGSPGERKLSKTLLRRRINLGLRNTTDLQAHIFRQYQQVIFEKRDTDIFAHARIERLISELPNCTFVICGAGLAKGIVQAAVGLRNLGFGVILARDAVLDLGDELADMAYRRMRAKGVVFARTSEIGAREPLGLTERARRLPPAERRLRQCV